MALVILVTRISMVAGWVGSIPAEQGPLEATSTPWHCARQALAYVSRSVPQMRCEERDRGLRQLHPAGQAYYKGRSGLRDPRHAVQRGMPGMQYATFHPQHTPGFSPAKPWDNTANEVAWRSSSTVRKPIACRTNTGVVC